MYHNDIITSLLATTLLLLLLPTASVAFKNDAATTVLYRTQQRPPVGGGSSGCVYHEFKYGVRLLVPLFYTTGEDWEARPHADRLCQTKLLAVGPRASSICSAPFLLGGLCILSFLLPLRLLLRGRRRIYSYKLLTTTSMDQSKIEKSLKNLNERDVIVPISHT